MKNIILFMLTFFLFSSTEMFAHTKWCEYVYDKLLNDAEASAHCSEMCRTSLSCNANLFWQHKYWLGENTNCPHLFMKNEREWSGRCHGETRLSCACFYG